MSKVLLGGVEVEVVSNEEANKATIAVCALAGPSEFTDNLFGVCACCGAAIMFRPYMPPKPRKLCPRCAVVALDLPGAGR